MNISVRLLKENELSEADRICRLAFGTFVGLPDPMTFFGDADYVRTRFYTDPSAAYAAILTDNDDDSPDNNSSGKLIGSNFTTNWGSVGFFGPLTIHPDYWGKGVTRSLMQPTMQLFSKWNTKHAGLFTFAHSPKHITLYQKFGFWPYFLTAIMSKGVATNRNSNRSTSQHRWSKYSEVSKDQEEEENQEGYLLNTCNRLTNDIYDGLDLSVEISSVMKQRLGDVVLTWDLDNNNNKNLAGFAVCHCGKGTEAGSNTCYLKFAAIQPSQGRANDSSLTESRFESLLNACEAFAAEQGMSRLVAGANTGRRHAYAKMLSQGYHIDILGVAMQRGNEMGYNRPDVYIIYDWR